ncbi:hypothetical protein J2X69_004829 [Algoriphagus sp. 4150]|uniref:hypothetical protein n=1 Tax=Algoriphagus sp. 4150 TaxID=2817756 RepID=UPI00285CF8AC|nr:hypothetical protein [Algoriphagus sp. 4150]MDR7132458.1 hypothetical protein [Algoriphagus sp. 4150]
MLAKGTTSPLAVFIIPAITNDFSSFSFFASDRMDWLKKSPKKQTKAMILVFVNLPINYSYLDLVQLSRENIHYLNLIQIRVKKIVDSSAIMRHGYSRWAGDDG